MAQKKKRVKRARNDGYQGVSFQNLARQTLGMLDEVTFKKRLISISTAWNWVQAAQEPT